MSFLYYIIDGTSYSFCTTSCIHVNLTKIAFCWQRNLLLTPRYSSIFSSFRPAVSRRFRGAKIKPFISFHQIFREKILSGFSCWTVLTSLLTFERITLIKLLVAKFCTWISQLLPINQEEDCFPSSFSLTTLTVRSSSISSLSSLPLSKAGAKVHGLSSHPNFTTISPMLNYAWSLIYSLYTKTRTAVFFIKIANSRGKETLARVS